MLVDALDHVPVELELADNDRGKVNPTGARLIERRRLPARPPELLEHLQLLGFNGPDMLLCKCGTCWRLSHRIRARRA